jgi:hypothetical protein
VQVPPDIQISPSAPMGPYSDVHPNEYIQAVSQQKSNLFQITSYKVLIVASVGLNMIISAERFLT